MLNHSLADEAFARLRPMLEDFSLALAAWADLGLQRFVALTPLDAERSAFVLWRARFLGAGELGTVAVANGLLISADQMERLENRAHRLLGGVPEPDGGPFGAEPVAAEAAATGAAPLAAFGLEWRDQVIDILDGADSEAVLVAALEGIFPAVQIARVDGWATTGALPASGAFDPAEAFRLIVRPEGETRAAAPSDRRVVQVRGGQVGTPRETPPAVWRAWQAVDRASEEGSAVWKSTWLTLPADRVATLALLQNAAPLGVEDRLAMIAEAVHQVSAEPDVVATMGSAAGQALVRLAANAEQPTDAARYLEAGLTEARFGVSTAREIARTAPVETGLAGLSAAALETAMDHGLLDRMAGAEGEAALGLFRPEVLMTMLGKALHGAAGMAAMRALAIALIGRLATGEALARRYAAAGVSALIDMRIQAEDVGLATPTVVGLVREFSRIDRQGYAAHALRPVLRGEVRLARPDFIAAMRATTRLLESAA